MAGMRDRSMGVWEVPGPFCRFLALGLLTLSGVGCQLIGSGGPGPEARTGPDPAVPLPSGVFDGFIEIEGGRVDGSLTLTPVDGAELEGFFEAPPDLEATGLGRMEGNEVSLELSYEGACPGRMRLRGAWELESGRLSGVLRARDCTGEAEGTFFFQRR